MKESSIPNEPKIDHIKDNFYLDPNRQDLEIIHKIDYSSGVYIEIEDRTSGNRSITNIHCSQNHVQHIGDLTEDQCCLISSKLGRYLQAPPSDHQHHPTIFIEGVNSTNQIPDFILQREKII